MKKHLIKHIVCLILIIIIGCSSNQQETNIGEKPNIVLIMADDLGYGDLSCYGSKVIKTPNIDNIAMQGLKFTDYHSNGPVCSSTRAALMTGKYQQRTGVEGVITAANHREVGLSLDEITIAEELKNAGYMCGIFGKWHLGYARAFNPSFQGFDEFAGFVSGNIDYHSHIDQEGYFDWWNDTTMFNEKGFTTDLITEYGIDFIRNNNPEKTGKPFFLYLPHEAPHYPVQGRNDKPLRIVGNGKYIRKVNKDSVEIIYKEMIEVMDEGIGEVMKTLSEEGLDKNTIVIFCSDNGAASRRGSNGELRGSKGSVYEGGHRVPALIRYPDKIKAGKVSKAQVIGMDLLPTLIDFVGSKPSGNNIDGISLKNLLVEGVIPKERDLFWSFKNKIAVRSGKWKLVKITTKGKTQIELFNLENDLSEEINLSDIEPQVVSEMLKKMEKWNKEVRKDVKTVSM